MSNNLPLAVSAQLAMGLIGDSLYGFAFVYFAFTLFTIDGPHFPPRATLDKPRVGVHRHGGLMVYGGSLLLASLQLVPQCFLWTHACS